MMYKIYNNIAPSYLNEMFLMRDTTLNNTASNLRSVASKNFIIPQAKCNLSKGSCIKDSSSLPIIVNKCTEWIKH